MPGGEEGTTTARQILEQVRDTMTVKRVFGEPISSEGCLVVPVAAFRGGGGGGGGRDVKGNDGSGGGYGAGARPIGVYRIQGEQVTWVPALDVTRVAVLGEIVAIVALLVLRSILRGRAKR